jgi:tRNA pseudouridine38-40 synthase
MLPLAYRRARHRRGEIVRTIRLTIEYEGTQFHGWQRQPQLRTVQGELEQALATILREPVSLMGAGRTDRGVHALAQVASFETSRDLPLERVRRSVNALTGPDVAVYEAREESSGFHARHSALARHYIYLIQERDSALWGARALTLPRCPDLARMETAVAPLVGEHDFAAFSCRASDGESTRTLVHYARWERWPRGIALRIGAVRFLYRMVRAIVAHGLLTGSAAWDPERTSALLRVHDARATRIAPARGLHLARVDYAGEGRPDCPPPFPVL